jgi:hypothetical protein
MAISPRKLAANQENARRSTGPQTPEGKARVRHNALKHGLLAKEVIVPVGDEQENRAEFDLLLNDLWQHYAPVGPVEKFLVEKIATACWRLRRATRAEVGELGLEFAKTVGSGVALAEMVAKMQKEVEEADPNADFGIWLQIDGAATLRSGFLEKRVLNLDIDKAAAYINTLGPAERKPWLLQALEKARQDHLEHERQEEAQAHRQALRAQRSLPQIVDKILRYETTIDRQLYRAITELEKLQAARRRTSSPAGGPTQAA